MNAKKVNSSTKKTKSSYSLREITTECTDQGPYDYDFDKAYKDVQRLVHAVEEFVEHNLVPIKPVLKPALVKLVRSIYFSKRRDQFLDDMKREPLVFCRIESSEGPAESDDWKMVGLLGLIEDFAKAPRYKTNLELLKEQSPEFNECVKKIKQQVRRDLRMACEMDTEQEKQEFLRKYWEIIEDSEHLEALGRLRRSVWRARSEKANKIIDSLDHPRKIKEKPSE